MGVREDSMDKLSFAAEADTVPEMPTMVLKIIRKTRNIDSLGDVRLSPPERARRARNCDLIGHSTTNGP